MHPKTMQRHSVLLAIVSLAFGGLLTTGGASAESKVRPDLPLDEEIYEPPTTKVQKKSQPDNAVQSKTKHDGAMHDGAKHDGAKHDDAKYDDAKHDDAKHESSTPASDSHKSKTGPDSYEAGEEEYHEPAHSSGAEESVSSEPKLLEGKVPPTPASKGSGMVWFVVIFVLLAAAIFIFT